MADYAINAAFEFTAKGLPEIAKQVESMMGKAGDSAVRSLAVQADKVGKSFNKQVSRALDMGLKKQADTLITVFNKTDSKVSKAMSEIQAAQESLQSATGTEAKYLNDLINKKTKLIEKELKGLNKATEKHERILEARQNMLENSGVKGAAKMADAVGDEMSDVFNKFQAGDLRGFSKAFGGALQKGGAGLEAAGAARAASGGKISGGIGKAMGAMGGAATAIGSAAATLAAAVGPLAAIAGAFMAADAAVKDMNKSLLEGAGAADIFTKTGAEGMLEFRDTLDSARGAAIDLSFEYRTNAKEIMGIIAAANEAGLTFSEMESKVGDAANKMDAYAQVAETALIYSRQLGVSTKEIAETSAQWLHDFGGSLQTVQQGFDSIFAAAQTSGIGVKRFYSMVSQATAGLALYNTSIEESAALIANMSKALGEQEAAEFVQGLQKGFSGESYQDRFKRIMITGQETTGKVIEAQAKTFGSRFVEGIESSAPEIQQGVKSAFAEAGIDFEGLASGDAETLQKISGMTEKAQRRLIAQVGQTDDASARQLQTLIGLTEGMSGSLTDQAKALDELGPGGVLAMQMGQATSFFGKGVSELGGVQLAAFEQMSGISGEQLHQLQRLDERMRADYELAREQGKEVGSFQEYLMENATQIEDAVAQPLSAQEAMAKQQVRNTESISAILENTITYLLERISDLLQMLYDSASGTDPHAQAMKEAVLEANAKQREAITENMEVTKQELSELQQKLDQTKGSQREEIRQKMTEKESELSGMEDVLDKLAKEEKETRKLETQGLIRGAFRELTTLGKAETATGAALSGNLEEEMGLAMGSRKRSYREEYGKELSDVELAMMSKQDKERLKGAVSRVGGKEGAAEAETAFHTRGEELEKQVEQGELTIETLQSMKAMEEAGLKEHKGVLEDVKDETQRSARKRKADMVKALLEVKARQVGGTLGLSGDDLEKFSEALVRGEKEAQDRVRTGFGQDKRVTESEAATAAQFGIKLQPTPDDFIYHTGSKSVTPLSNKDTILGAMEGGPPSQAMGGGGGPMTVNINVNGGNQREVYATVKKAVAAGKRDRVGRGAR